MRKFLTFVFFLFPLLLTAAPRAVDWSLERVDVRGNSDSLRLSLDWRFDDWGAVNSGGAVVFSVILKGTNVRFQARPVVVYGREAAKNAKTICASGHPDEVIVDDLSSEVRIRMKDSFMLAEEADSLVLMLSIYDWNKAEGRVLMASSKRGTYIRPESPKPFAFDWSEAVPEESGSGFREMDIPFSVQFDYESQRYDATFLDNAASMDDVFRVIKSFTSSRTFPVRDASVFLYVPPSGGTKDAQALAKARVKSLQSYLERRGAFKSFRGQCVLRGEDWDGVRDWVADSRLSGDPRLQEILSAQISDEERWNTIAREKPASFDLLNAECFPYVGKAVFHVSYRPASFVSPNFIAPVFDDVPEALTPLDFYNLAKIYEKGTPQWFDVMLTGIDLNPDCEPLVYNAVMALLDADMDRKASTYLRFGDGVPSARMRYAYAYWCYKVGRFDECVEILKVLSGISAGYRDTFSRARPYIEWATGRVPWIKLNI